MSFGAMICLLFFFSDLFGLFFLWMFWDVFSRTENILRCLAGGQWNVATLQKRQLKFCAIDLRKETDFLIFDWRPLLVSIPHVTCWSWKQSNRRDRLNYHGGCDHGTMALFGRHKPSQLAMGISSPCWDPWEWRAGSAGRRVTCKDFRPVRPRMLIQHWGLIHTAGTYIYIYVYISISRENSLYIYTHTYIVDIWLY